MEIQSQVEPPAARQRSRPRNTVTVLPPTYVSLPDDELDEVVKLLAEVIVRALKRRQIPE